MLLTRLRLVEVFGEAEDALMHQEFQSANVAAFLGLQLHLNSRRKSIDFGTKGIPSGISETLFHQVRTINVIDDSLPNFGVISSPHLDNFTHRSPVHVPPTLPKQGEPEKLPKKTVETGMDLVDAEVKPIWAQPRPGRPSKLSNTMPWCTGNHQIW